MKRVGNLFEKIVSFENLLLGAKKALRGKQFKKACTMFYFHLEDELLKLQEELATGLYTSRPYELFEIREPKVRLICAAHFRDRVVHHAICNILDPIFERRLIFDTYACRVGKGAHKAIKRLQFFSKRYSYFLKCDIKKYFESIDHMVLKNLLRRVMKDDQVFALLDLIIDHPVPSYLPGKGLPIGNLTSQHFANLYLGELDHFTKERLRVKGYLRYMDDFIVLSDNKRKLHTHLDEIKNFLGYRLELSLKEKALQIAPVTEGVPFLGFRVYPQLIRLQRRNLVRWRKKMRSKQVDFIYGKISEDQWIQSMRSMIAHISHAHSRSLRKKDLESWNLLAQ